VRPRGDETRSPRRLLGDFTPTNTGPEWSGYVPIRVKTRRVLGLDGQGKFTSDYLEVVSAAGVIEIAGGRQGRHSTALWVGFSFANKLPEPSFVLSEQMAVGTLVLPATLFQAWLEILSQPAYFRIGGDGRGNAISSDITFWG